MRLGERRSLRSFVTLLPFCTWTVVQFCSSTVFPTSYSDISPFPVTFCLVNCHSHLREVHVITSAPGYISLGPFLSLNGRHASPPRSPLSSHYNLLSNTPRLRDRRSYIRSTSHQTTRYLPNTSNPRCHTHQRRPVKHNRQRSSCEPHPLRHPMGRAARLASIRHQGASHARRSS